VLATKHGKLPLIAPPLDRAVGLKVEAVTVDTDALGTFTGDIPRRGSPLDVAIAKARLGMSAAGCTLGVASEGSIGPDPAMPFVIRDLEIVVLVDDVHGLVVWESETSWDIVAASTSARPDDDLGPFLSKACFPEHQLIVRPNSGRVRPVYKGISSVEMLKAAIAECSAVATDGLARVETDFRAHACPSRRATIAKAAWRLAQRIAARCPACGVPGWGSVDLVVGIPCARCGMEIDRPRAEVYGCVACEHRETKPIDSAGESVDPSECPFCNP
jgi:hypothetical protein